MSVQTIFTTNGNAELIYRINKLTEHTPALWGKMNAAQMMAHMQAGMNIAFGNAKNKRHWIGILFGWLGKRRLLKEGDFDRHMPAFKQGRITDQHNFAGEKAKLLTLVKYALDNGPNIVVKYPHPYFGTFKNDEWAQLNWKHFDHHLRQFGG